MPPLCLTHVHRAVRLLQRAARFGVQTKDRNAGGSARSDIVAAEHEGEPVDRFFQGGRLGPGVGLAEIPQQHGELVAAEAADHIGGAYLAGYGLDDRLQHLVAGGVAERVVDRFEAIDVEHDQRGGGVIALDVGDGAVELALKAAPVQDSEQEVGFSGRLQGLDLRLGLREFRPQPANRRLLAAGGCGVDVVRARCGADLCTAMPVLRLFAVPDAAALLFFFITILVEACV